VLPRKPPDPNHQDADGIPHQADVGVAREKNGTDAEARIQAANQIDRRQSADQI
jgi:hypothetical protein